MRKITLVFVIFFTTQITYGQVIIPGDYAREYYDLLLFQDTSINQPINQFPSIIKQYHISEQQSWNIWGENFNLDFSKSKNNSSFFWINPLVRYNYNTLTPRSYNDGAQWNGRGSNLFLSGGFAGHIGILHYAFVPSFQVSENKDVWIPPNLYDNRSEFAYPFENWIDFVQRYGNETYYNFDLGQSEVRLIYKNATIGVSTENFRWGVTQLSPILMSYNAAGFPHVDIGTNVPAQTKIGKIEGRMFWGMTRESDYFDNNPVNETGYITGLYLGYQPSFFPEMSFGFNRVMNTRWSDGNLSWKDAFVMFTRNTHSDSAKNDEYDQMMSAYIDFSFKSVGFRTYFEYSRNDFPGRFNDLFEHPDRTAGHTIGLQKTFDLKNEKILSIIFESSSVSMNQLQTFTIGFPTYYVHRWSVRGYTHNGQIIGAGMGPGSNSNLLKIELYQPSGKWGITFSRIRFNDDYLVNAYAGQRQFPTDYEVSLGIDYVRFINALTIHPTFLWSYRKNWFFQDDLEVVNYYLGINLSYNLSKNSR